MKIDYLANHKKYVDVVNKWQFEQWGGHYRDSSREEWLAELKNRLNKGEVPTVLIALKGDQPVGTASLVERDMGSFRDYSPWLADVYVQSKHRGQGIGTKLITRAVEEARQIGIETLYLFTRDKQELYLNLGWNRLESTKYNDKPVEIMYIKLD